MGTDFWIGFIPNESNILNPGVTLSVFITWVIGASGTITNTGLGNHQAFTVAPNGYVQVSNTPMASMGDGSSLELVESKGLQILSDYPIAVYGMNNVKESSDGFLALPAEAIGTDYYGSDMEAETMPKREWWRPKTGRTSRSPCRSRSMVTPPISPTRFR